jgi:hypothetical protein
MRAQLMKSGPHSKPPGWLGVVLESGCWAGPDCCCILQDAATANPPPESGPALAARFSPWILPKPAR